MTVVSIDFKKHTHKTKHETNAELLTKLDEGFLDVFFNVHTKLYILKASLLKFEKNNPSFNVLKSKDREYIHLAKFASYEFSSFLSIMYNFLILHIESTNPQYNSLNKTEELLSHLIDENSKLRTNQYTLINNIEDIINEAKRLAFDSVYYTSYIYNNIVLKLENNKIKEYINIHDFKVINHILSRTDVFLYVDKHKYFTVKESSSLKNEYIRFDPTNKPSLLTKFISNFKHGNIRNDTPRSRAKLIKSFK